MKGDTEQKSITLKFLLLKGGKLGKNQFNRKICK